MAGSIARSLAGTMVTDDGTCAVGAVPVYGADGSIKQLAPSKPTSGLGGVATRLNFFEARNNDGTTLDGTGAAGKFKIANTTGTSLSLLSEGAKNNTKTDTVDFLLNVPQFYNAGDNITVTVNAQHTLNGGTAGTKTVLAGAYLLADAGTSSANLVATGAATLTTGAAEYTFTITGATLTPGARMLIQVTGVIQETANAGTNTTMQVNSVRLS